MADVTLNFPTTGLTAGSVVTADIPTSTLLASGSATITPYVYVCDSGNHRIQVFDHDGSYLFSFGSQGSGDGEFESPYGVSNDGTRVYVTDSGNHRVQYFDLIGNYLGQWGSYGTGDGQFQTPMGIAVNGRYAFVVDNGNNRFQIFSALGTFVIAVSDVGDHTLLLPTDCYVDEFFLYIDDNGNGHIDIFELTLPTNAIDSSFPEFTSAIVTAKRSGRLDSMFPEFTSAIATSLQVAAALDSVFPTFQSDIRTLTMVESNIDSSFPVFSSSIETANRTSVVIASDFPAFQSSIITRGQVRSAILSQFPDFRSAIITRVSGGSSVLVVVVNTKNKAISNFTNYDFNSMALFQDKYIGASPTGIFEMTGADDDVVSSTALEIDARIKTGDFDLHENNQVRNLEDACLFGTFGDDVLLIFRGNIDTLRQFTVPAFVRNVETTLRQKFGRGLKDRVFSLEIQNVDGGNLELTELAIDAEAVYRQKKRG